MINYPYHFARLEGRIARDVYRAALPFIIRRKIDPPRNIDIDVFAYSNEETMPEQIASIRSFLKFVGRPTSFIVFSDSTHSDQSVRLLEQIDPVVRIQRSVAIPDELPEKIATYLTTHAMGKQLALIMSLPANRPALYVDSDVLFFPGASDFVNRSGVRDAPAYYLSDCRFSGDDRLILDPPEEKYPVNAGFLLLFEKLDWALGLERLLQLSGQPNFFTTQTIVHLTMHLNRAQPLDPLKYVLQIDDQTIYRDRYAGPAIAMRHYVNNVRHKFWTHFAR
jgi:hypothetical protein